MIRPCRGLLAAAGLALFAGTAHAQRPAIELAALRDSVASIANPTGLSALLASVDQANLPTAEREARKGWILLRAGELGTGRDYLDQAITAFDEAVLREHDWPEAWVGLARAKLLLSERQMPVKRSLHQANGEHYDDAAMSHLARSLELKPKNPPAVALLTDLLIDREGLPLKGDVAEAVTRAAAEPANGPVPHLLLARNYRLADRLDDAIKELQNYYALGGDSALGLLEQARTEYRQKQLDQSVVTYLAGAIRLDSLSRAAYRRDLAWSASPAEMAAFDSSADSTLGRWITAFWARRDAEAVQPPGSALQEHFRRWFYALDHFHTIGESRGNSLLGIRPGETAGGLSGSEDNMGMRLFDATTYKETPRYSLGVDDRGTIYLRYGEPTMRASSNGSTGGSEGCLAANESWRYDLPTGPRVFNFCASMALGTNAPTTLVPVLPLVPEILESRIAMDPRYAQLAFDISSAQMRQKWRDMAARANAANALDGSSSAGTTMALDPQNTVSRDIVQALQNEGRVTIERSLKEDSYARHYDRDLEPVVQLYALGAIGGGGSTALVVFALPGDKLKPEIMSGRIVYPVHIRLTAVDTSRGVSANSDTTRLFVTRDTLRAGTYLYGTAVLPIGPGRYYLRALFDQPTTTTGGAKGRSGVVIPADGGSLSMSDLVPGVEGSLTFAHGSEPIPLNPLGVFHQKQTMQVYYELHGATPGEEYKTDVELAKLSGGAPSKSERLNLSFKDRPNQPTWHAQRSLSLENLDPGVYLLTVTVHPDKGDATTSRNVVVRITK